MPVGMMQLSKLRKDGGTQQRAKLDYSVVSEYAERMKAGDDFPPVDVFYDGEEHWLASGFHRVEAASEAGKKAIPAIMHKGTLREAILFSCGANVGHGLRRTNADKRKCVTTLLDDIEWGKYSDERIAEICCVSRNTVKAIRDDQGVKKSPLDKRIGRDGKSYPVKITQPPKPRIETIEDDDEDTDTEDATDIHDEPEPARKPAAAASLYDDGIIDGLIDELAACLTQRHKQYGGKSPFHGACQTSLSDFRRDWNAWKKAEAK